MSDTDKTSPAPDNVAAPITSVEAPAAPPAEAPAAKTAPPERSARPSKPSYRDRQKPRRERGTPVPSLDFEVRTAGPNMKELDAEIEKELQEALGDTAEGLLAESTRIEKASPEQSDAPPGRKKGKVISVHGADVFVQVPGGRSEGVLSALQFPDGPPEVGSEVEVHIEGYDRANGLLVLSRVGAASAVENWSSVQEGLIVEARVTETNKGGLTVDVSGIRGFIPVSQIDLYRVEQPEQYVNQRLICMVTEVNPGERNLVLSRRAFLEKEREEQRVKLWAELAEGQTREGVVRSLQPFGAFVDLGGMDGLVHVSEMSWSRVKDPASVLQPGQRIKVQVLRIDREKHKISLGMKQLMASPWDAVLERYSAGAVVTGKVTRTTEFGAFVELEPGIEGLVHISELAPQRINRVSDVVKPEQEVKVMVLSVDPEARRISLSLRAALPKSADEDDEEDENYEAPPPRPRNVPLRGGVGGERFVLERPQEEEPPKTEQ